jgi:hypothetical protein
MDYYQKYQKYKFKYLNLLSFNQSGGDETDTDTNTKYSNLINEVTIDELKNINENANYSTYQKNLQICIKAVKKNGCVLQYVKQDELKNNDYSHLCYEAVKQKGLALQYVKQNEKIIESIYILCCKTAVEQDPTALQYVPEKYKEFVFSVKKNDITDCTIS